MRDDTGEVPKAEITEEIRFEWRLDAQRERSEGCLLCGG